MGGTVLDGTTDGGEQMSFPDQARMMERTIMLALLLALWPAAVPGTDGVPRSSEAEARLAAGGQHAVAGRYFLAVNEYRQAIAHGLDGCDVRWKLSLALYGLGLVDEAIGEIGMARRLCPDANFLHLPSGIIYLARGELEAAAQHFVAALQVNPGFADAYYYLGEVYYRQGNYPRAWLCCLMAETLGHPGDSLGDKLSAVLAAPVVTPWRNEPGVLHLRLIQLPSRDEAQTVLQRLEAGELFENIAAECSPELNQGFGGYAGVVAPADLDSTIAAALNDLTELAPPLVLEMAGGYQVVQRIAPFDPTYWDQLLTATPRESHAIAPEPSRPAPLMSRAAVSGEKPAKAPAVSVAGASPEGLRSAAESALPFAAPTTVPIKPPATAAVVPHPYRLHAGSHDTENDARKQVAALKQLGFPSFQFRMETAGGSYHVIAGKYASRVEAEAGAARLKQLGINHYISRQQ